MKSNINPIRQIVKADLKLLFREYNLKFFFPISVLGTFVMTRCFDFESLTLLMVLNAFIYSLIFETMLCRNEHEYLNYSLTQVDTKKVIFAKNISSSVVFFVLSLTMVNFWGLFTGAPGRAYLEVWTLALVVVPLLLLTGNIVSIRRMMMGKTSISFLNNVITGAIIFTGILIFKLLTIIFSLKAGFIICSFMYFVAYLASINETAESMEKNFKLILEKK